MFNYIRYFSAISFIIVVVAAWGVGVYFRTVAANDLKFMIEQSNVALGQGFVNTVWRNHSDLLEKLANKEVSEWKNYEGFIKFNHDAARYFESIPIAKVNVYTTRGKRFLTTSHQEIIFFDQDEAGKNSKEATKQGFISALKGVVHSRIIPNSGFHTPDGNLKRGTLVQTFFPVIADSYVPIVQGSDLKVESVIEVFHDVTPITDQLYLFQMVSTGGIILIFLTLIAALIYTSRKAENIIAKQHEKTLELTAAKARAEAESTEKSKFLANISHELRTPLNAIIGFSDILKQRLEMDGNKTYEEYVNDIHTSGVHLLSLINDILDYSKASAGKLELEIADVDATKTILSSMRLVSPRAEEAKVRLVSEVPKEHFVISTDAKKLKQVLLNLLSNAVKFTPEEGSVTVSAWQNVTDGSITIEVKDTGIGIAPKDISKAMSPFGQVDSELSRKYEGTGLGLPLTKKFVEVMGGTFNIQSELGVGTTISITFPKEAPEQFRKKGSNLE